jgi:hypothetical protein
MALACRVNAALTQWTTVIESVALATLAVDRVLMFRQWDDPKVDIRNRLMKILPAVVWLYGTAVVAPIVATSHIVGVRPFAERLVPIHGAYSHLCRVTENIFRRCGIILVTALCYKPECSGFETG